MGKQFDRAAEDLGNIVGLEHVNVTIPDQGLATVFYVSGLGLTRDPYLMTSIDNMWVNVGRNQFHLPTGKAQVLRGHTGLTIPGRELLLARLARVKPMLEGTKYSFSEANDYVEATCPWGNRYRCYEPGRFGTIQLGMPYVEFDVPTGVAQGTAEFYRDVFDTLTSAENGAAHVSVGQQQELVFRETDKPIPAYDGHHIQVYVASFSGPHKKLQKRGLVSEESNQYQYRFEHIVDKAGKKLFQIEHEIRSMTHPMYARPLVNRNPAQTNRTYVATRDAWVAEFNPEDVPGRVMRRATQ